MNKQVIYIPTENEICCIWTDKQLTLGGSETLLRFQQCILIDLQVGEREVSSFCRLPMKLPKNLFVQNSLQSSVKKDYLATFPWTLSIKLRQIVSILFHENGLKQTSLEIIDWKCSLVTFKFYFTICPNSSKELDYFSTFLWRMFILFNISSNKPMNICI